MCVGYFNSFDCFIGVWISNLFCFDMVEMDGFIGSLFYGFGEVVGKMLVG